MKSAPIILFAYNRPHHTRLCLKSISNNSLASESTLFIFVDGVKDITNRSQVQLNEEVKVVAKEEKWCGEVIIEESLNNKGLARSVIYGVSKVIEKYGKAIVLEDDLYCSPHFLNYMNQALNLYEHEKDVACISAYIYPVKNELPNTFFIKGADCWGWATWKRAWDLFEEDGLKLLRQLEQKGLERDFDFDGSYPYVRMLKDQINGKNDSWAIRWYASAYLQDKLCLYPGRSLIQNIGTDGSGTHSGITSSLEVKLSEEPVIPGEIPVQEDIQSKKIIASFFRTLSAFHPGFKEKLKTIYRKFLPLALRQKLFALRSLSKKNSSQWSGDYKNWKALLDKCSGYDNQLIFEKVKAAALAVKEGRAVFERDSVLFYKEEYDGDFLECLRTVAEANGGQLNVLDFGGSLGSTYFQYQNKWKEFTKVSWSVVEQDHFVKFGSKELQNENLRFYHNMETCLKEQKVNLILLSSVLSYLEKPYSLLDEIFRNNIQFLLIEKNLLQAGNKDLLVRQDVPEQIYNASYPCWILGKEKLLSHLSRNYQLVKNYFPFGNTPIHVNSGQALYEALFFIRR